MKFGKLQDISKVDFSLPPNPKENDALLAKYKRVSTPKLYIGCTGWSMKEWVGKVYPEKTKASNFLKYYAQQFNTIELNATHYRIPTSETIQKWIAETPDDFRFCPKLPQSVSHSRDLGLESGNLSHFCSTIQQLEQRLGCCFMQLPPYFGADRIGMLERFLKEFPSYIPLAIELRHESWFENTVALERFFQLLKHKNTTALITDVAGRRDVLHLRLTNARTMIRFVGNALDPTDYTRIDAWVQQLDEWTTKGVSEIYFFPHEPDNILAPDLAVYLQTAVQKKINDICTRGPKFYQRPEDTQMSLF